MLLVVALVPLVVAACQARAGRSGTPTPDPEARPDVCADDACIDGTVVAVTGAGSILPFKTVPVRLSGPASRIVQTNTDGRFIFASLAPGQYTVTIAEAPGYEFSPSRSSVLQRAQRRQIEALHADVAVPPKAQLIFTYLQADSGLKP